MENTVQWSANTAWGIPEVGGIITDCVDDKLVTYVNV